MKKTSLDDSCLFTLTFGRLSPDVNYMYLCVCVSVCTQVWKSAEGFGSPWSWSSIQLSATQHWCGELDSGPLEEHQALLTAEPPLQPHYPSLGPSFEEGSHVAQDGLKLLIFLPQPPNVDINRSHHSGLIWSLLGNTLPGPIKDCLSLTTQEE